MAVESPVGLAGSQDLVPSESGRLDGKKGLTLIPSSSAVFQQSGRSLMVYKREGAVDQAGCTLASPQKGFYAVCCSGAHS